MLVNRDGWVTVPLTMQATASRYSETGRPRRLEVGGTTGAACRRPDLESRRPAYPKTFVPLVGFSLPGSRS